LESFGTVHRVWGTALVQWQGVSGAACPRGCLGTGPITVAQQVEQKVTLIIEPKLWLCVRVVPIELLN